MLVWERICNYIIDNTEWQFFNEARINGEGPVVASIGRVLQNSKRCEWQIRIHGKIIYVQPHGDISTLEKIAESEFSKYGSL